jgi:hypothetical protein
MFIFFSLYSVLKLKINFDLIFNRLNMFQTSKKYEKDYSSPSLSAISLTCCQFWSKNIK